MDYGVLAFVTAVLAAMSVRAWYRVATHHDETDGRGFRTVVAGGLATVASIAGYPLLQGCRNVQIA